LESRWEKNAQIAQILAGQMFPLAECDENPGNKAVCQ
jgi:hypothetical protein